MPSVASRIIEVCVFKFEKDHARYLLLHRSKEERRYPNIWQLISGTMEGTEKASDAALRELIEETKLRPTAIWNVPFANSFYDHDHDVLNVSPFFAAQVEIGNEPELSPEHYESGWFAYEDAIRKLVWPGQRMGLRVVHEYIVGGQEAALLTRIA